MIIDKLKQMPLLKELNANPRLQWLLLLVLVILLGSMLKAGTDANTEIYSELSAQQNLTNRLQTASDTPFDEQAFMQLQKRVDEMVLSVPSAAAISIAEAQALSELNKLREKIYSDGRTTLLGTETLTFGTQSFYQTRIELNGSHDLLKLIELLYQVDGSKLHMRLVTLQIRSGRRTNTLTLVMDYLHRQEIK
jgi:hypothetical protein